MTFICYDNEVHQELALMALAASPTPEAACEYLQAEHQITAVPAKLTTMARYRRAQYEELRERVAPLKEKVLTHNLLDNALYASEVTQLAMGQLNKMLEEERIPAQFLSKVARDIADVQAKATDKRMTLEGRPTSITENRSPQEIIKALERLHVVKQIEVTSGE